MQPPSFAVLKPGEVFHGRYRVRRCIKTGGMGAVYDVVDENTDAPRALKVMLPNIVHDREHRARFALEARVTGGIESDHLVRVSDAGIDDETGTPFIAMDLLRGEEIAQILAQRGTLPPEEVVLYLHQAALALDKTHAAGIVHRDLKPANLFLTHRDDGSPCLKILDFGIAKVVQPQASEDGTRPLGTPLYMAPEQIRGVGTIGPRADLYALGQIAYTLLSGEAYWAEDAKGAETLFPLLSKIVAGAEEPAVKRALRRTGNVLVPAMDGWFAKATAPAEDDRFERATEQVAALARVLGVAAPALSISGAAPARTSDPRGRLSLRAEADVAGKTDSAVTSSTTGKVARSGGKLLLIGASLIAGGLVAALVFIRPNAKTAATPPVSHETESTSAAAQPTPTQAPVVTVATAAATAAAAASEAPPAASAPHTHASATAKPAVSPRKPLPSSPAPTSALPHHEGLF